MFYTRLNNFPVFRNYRDIDFALHCMDVLATDAQITMNWNLVLNFVKIKQMNFKRRPSSYLPNVGVGDIERFYMFNLLASAWHPKRRFDQSDKSSVNRAVETLHSLMLSSHLFFYLPLLLAPFIDLCRIVFAMPKDFEMWPYHLSFRFLTIVRRSSCTPIAFRNLLRTSSFVTCSL